MKPFLATAAAAAVALVVGSATSASAALITGFNNTTNDGVYTLSQAQADMLGAPGADRIGFFRVREGYRSIYNAGDTFDARSILNSTRDDDKILAILNGTNAGLTYTGGAFEALGTTTLGAANSYYKAVAFLFRSTAGNIVFAGTSTFNGGQTRGTADFLPAPVPLPAAGLVLLTALGGAAVAYRRRRSG